MKKIVSINLIVILITVMLAGVVNAASASLSVSASSLKIDDDLSVTVNFGGNVSGAQFTLKYDSSKLQYVSNTAGGLAYFNNQTGQFAYVGIEDDLPSVTFKFKAAAEGNATISIGESFKIIRNEEDIMLPAVGSKTIKIEKQAIANDNTNTSNTGNNNQGTSNTGNNNQGSSNTGNNNQGTSSTGNNNQGTSNSGTTNNSGTSSSNSTTSSSTKPNTTTPNTTKPNTTNSNTTQNTTKPNTTNSNTTQNTTKPNTTNQNTTSSTTNSTDSNKNETTNNENVNTELPIEDNKDDEEIENNEEEIFSENKFIELNAEDVVKLEDNENGIIIASLGDTVEDGVTVRSQVIEEDAERNEKLDNIMKEIEGKKKFFDIKLLKNNITVQPDGYVTVYIPIPSEYNKEQVKLFFVDEENGLMEEKEGQLKGDYYAFTTNHFSVYALVEVPEQVTESKESAPNTVYIIIAGIVLIIIAGLVVYVKFIKE